MTCEEYGIEIDDGDYPCCDCGCGAQKDNKIDVTHINPCGENCNAGCTHPECMGRDENA